MAGAIGDIQQQRLLDIQNTVYSESDGILPLLQLQGYLDTIDSDIVDSQSAASSLAYQAETQQILNHELGRLNNKKNGVDDAYAGTKRMVQLNQNYQKRYWDYTKILVVWVFVLVLYLAFKMIETYFPVVPPVLFDVLMIFLVVFGIGYTVYIYGTLQQYDLANYGKLNLSRPSVAPTKDPYATLDPGSTANGKEGSNYLKSSFDGQNYCGEGTKWSALGGYCRPSSTSTTVWDVKTKGLVTGTCVSNKLTYTSGGPQGSASNDVCEPFGPSESSDYGFVR